MTASKPPQGGVQDASVRLPEWPDREACHKYHLKNGTDGWIEDADYYNDLSDAALARMEALVEYAMHTGAWCSQNSGHACTCGLSELLAACERRKS